MDDQITDLKEGIIHDKEVVYDSDTYKPVFERIYKKNGKLIKIRDANEIQLAQKKMIIVKVAAWLTGVALAAGFGYQLGKEEKYNTNNNQYEVDYELNDEEVELERTR